MLYSILILKSKLSFSGVQSFPVPVYIIRGISYMCNVHPLVVKVLKDHINKFGVFRIRPQPFLGAFIFIADFKF